MYYFYVLRFKKNKKFYYGFTNDLRKRIVEHQRGGSDFTSRNGKFDLVFYEAYINKKDARAAEKYFKTGHGREVLKSKLANYLEGVYGCLFPIYLKFDKILIINRNPV